MSFADLEQRSNAAVMRRLSNARAAMIGGSGDFPVIFDRAHIEAQGVSASAPVVTALDSDITAQGVVSNVSQLAVRGHTYTVRDIQPDGTGMSLLILEA
jgi:hypothetical protein